MKRMIVNEVLKPLARRLGSVIAGGLLALGATQDLASQVELCVPAALALLADLILSHMNRVR